MQDATARRNDPITSHRAADRMNTEDRLTEAEQFTLDAIAEYPGRTAKQLERLKNDIEGVIHRRIATLVRKGKVRKEYPKNCREALLYLMIKDTLF